MSWLIINHGTSSVPVASHDTGEICCGVEVRCLLTFDGGGVVIGGHVAAFAEFRHDGRAEQLAPPPGVFVTVDELRHLLGRMRITSEDGRVVWRPLRRLLGEMRRATPSTHVRRRHVVAIPARRDEEAAAGRR